MGEVCQGNRRKKVVLIEIRRKMMSEKKKKKSKLGKDIDKMRKVGKRLMGENEQLQLKRRKHWSELNECEKADRCREILKVLMGRVGSLSRRIDKLEDHRHDHQSGGIVVPLLRRDFDGPKEGMMQGSGPDDCYF